MKFGGTFDLNYLTNYAVDYSLGNNQDSEYGVGRLGSLNSMLFYFNDSNPKTITIGDGPDIFVDKNNEDEVSKDYGVFKIKPFYRYNVLFTLCRYFRFFEYFILSYINFFHC